MVAWLLLEDGCLSEICANTGVSMVLLSISADESIHGASSARREVHMKEDELLLVQCMPLLVVRLAAVGCMPS